jgi:hypothetical protein
VAKDPIVLDLLALQAQLYATQKDYKKAHDAIASAKRLFEATDTEVPSAVTARRAGVFLAELVLLYNEGRYADMGPILPQALNNLAFSNGYAGATHFFAAKYFMAKSARPDTIRVHLELAESLLDGATTNEFASVKLELAKLVLKQKQRDKALKYLNSALDLQEEMRALAAGTPMYWRQLLSREYTESEDLAMQLLFEDYAESKSAAVLRAIVRVNELSRSRGVRDGITAAHVGYMADFKNPGEPQNPAVRWLRDRIKPPIPPQEKIFDHLKQTVAALDTYSKLHNSLLIYIPCRKVDQVLVVVCQGERISAHVLKEKLSAIEQQVSRTSEGFQELAILYNRIKGSVVAIKKREQQLQEELESLADVLLPGPAADGLREEGEKAGLLVVPSSFLNDVPFIALRLKAPGGGRTYLRDAVSRFSVIPSVHALHLLMYYAVAEADIPRPKPSERRLLMASDPALDRAEDYQKAVKKAWAGKELQASTPEEFVRRFPKSGGVDVFAHGKPGGKDPLAAAFRLKGGDVTLEDLLRRVQPNVEGGVATLAVCRAAQAREVARVDGWSMALAFLNLKIEAVVASAWDLDEGFAADFFPAFYQAYRRDGVDSARAFLQALRQTAGRSPDYLKADGTLGYESPCFWGGIFHFGW